MPHRTSRRTLLTATAATAAAAATGGFAATPALASAHTTNASTDSLPADHRLT